MNEQDEKRQGWELAEALRKSAETADDMAVSAVRLMQQAGRERDELRARIDKALEMIDSASYRHPVELGRLRAALSGPASPPVEYDGRVSADCEKECADGTCRSMYYGDGCGGCCGCLGGCRYGYEEQVEEAASGVPTPTPWEPCSKCGLYPDGDRAPEPGRAQEFPAIPGDLADLEPQPGDTFELVPWESTKLIEVPGGIAAVPGDTTPDPHAANANRDPSDEWCSRCDEHLNSDVHRAQPQPGDRVRGAGVQTGLTRVGVFDGTRSIPTGDSVLIHLDSGLPAWVLVASVEVVSRKEQQP
jgi:hypothetical protein